MCITPRPEVKLRSLMAASVNSINFPEGGGFYAHKRIAVWLSTAKKTVLSENFGISQNFGELRAPALHEPHLDPNLMLPWSS